LPDADKTYFHIYTLIPDGMKSLCPIIAKCVMIRSGLSISAFNKFKSNYDNPEGQVKSKPVSFPEQRCKIIAPPGLLGTR
jgi:hypothetical protein